jgi:hypothetical protein
MTSAALMLLLLVASPMVAASELGRWRDLHVQVEPLTEPVVVNGVTLVVSRATGKDVELLAKRLGQKWSEESGTHAVRPGGNGNWRILSRIHDAGLEVLQWRDVGADAELLLSRMELPAKAQAPAHVGLGIPAGCKAGRIVSGWVDSHSYSQQAALCTGSPRAALYEVRRNAIGHGYEVLPGNGQLLARKGTSEVTVFAWHSGDASAASATSMVFLQVDAPETAR